MLVKNNYSIISKSMMLVVSIEPLTNFDSKVPEVLESLWSSCEALIAAHYD